MARGTSTGLRWGAIMSVLAGLAGLTGLTAGCGQERVATRVAVPRPEQVLAASVLTERDVPEGFWPAEVGRAVTALRPPDPDCAALLRVANATRPDELRGAGSGAVAAASFYSESPVLSLHEHIFRLPPGEARQRLTESRAALARCPSIAMDAGRKKVALNRYRLPHPKGARDAVAVRYQRGDARKGYSGVDIVLARLDHDLLVITAPGEFSWGGHRKLQRAVAQAVRKARPAAREHAAAVKAAATASPTSRATDARPSPSTSP